MAAWEKDSTESFINKGYFRITDPGPLHAPIQNFSVCRNDKLQYVLKTCAPSDAKCNAVHFPAGTVRLTTECVELESLGGTKATLIGVIPLNTVHGADERGIGEIREEAQVHAIEGRVKDVEDASYTIDWLGNVSGHSFIWPDLIHTEIETKTTRTLGRDKSLTLSQIRESVSTGSSAVKLCVSGTDLYLCVTSSKSDNDPLRSGCIVYVGTPDETFRRKIRDCLSFALGVYLVHLGTSTFTADWRLAAFKSISAYSLGGKAFAIVNLPPAPLHASWKFGIDETWLSRAVNAIFVQYDALNFRSLSWAYWHAQCATPHIAAVHFGAAIEALLRRYVEERPETFSRKLVADKAAWREFSRMINSKIEELPISEENKVLLTANLGSLNRIPLKTLMARVLTHLNIRLGELEMSAWKRRDDAAHGNEMEQGGELALIRDNKLLSIIFHRLVLRMTDAADCYQDYFSYGHAIRKLEEPVPQSA